MARDQGIIGEAVARISSKRTMTLKFSIHMPRPFAFPAFLPELCSQSYLSSRALGGILDVTSAPRERAMHWLYVQLTRAESIATGGW